MADFIPGLKLSELYYQEVVTPMLSSQFPGLIHSAGLIGHGSEVQRFDTPISRDHEWGPRVFIYLNDAELIQHHLSLDEYFRNNLPSMFRGYSTNFTDPREDNTRALKEIHEGPINHLITFTTIQDQVQHITGIDTKQELSSLDWLLLTEQSLREITGGKVFHDGLGELIPLREKFAYYPEDVWYFLLAAQWTRISQEHAFMGRTGENGDEAGSAIIAARLIRDCMKMCFLIERQYAPYMKWFGKAFSQLVIAEKILPSIESCLHSQGWEEREKHLVKVYEQIVKKYNSLQLTPSISEKTDTYYNRPYQVIQMGSVVIDLLGLIRDTALKKVPVPGVGAIDQFIDNTDALESPELLKKLKPLYEPSKII
ncbi:MAG: DUF4037 domain-containing protein [Anaerolineales bacterium]|nr:DUF4037 domain-containing protein [Anaerolineales bacterium]